MYSLLDDVVRKENVWPTIVSVIVPLIQLVAIAIVDISGTLNLGDLFIDPEILPLSNVIALLIIAASIGFYWFWKENYNWFNFEKKERRGFHHDSVKRLLWMNTTVILISAIVLVASLVLGRSPNAALTKHEDIFAVAQVVSYILFISAVGVVAYIGLSEFARKEKSYKPEQYLNNLLTTMQNYGTVERPRIHVKEQRTLGGSQLQILVNVEIGSEEKYLITNFNGLEINKELSAAEYRAVVQQQQSQASQ